MEVCTLEPLDLEKFAHLFPEELLAELPADTLLVGCVEEESLCAAGILMAHVEELTLMIDWIYVDEALRRRGAATAMLRLLLDAAKQAQDLEGVCVVFAEDQQNMESFLKSCDFIVGYYGGCRGYLTVLENFHKLREAPEKDGEICPLKNVPEEELDRFNEMLDTGMIPHIGIRPPIRPELYRPESYVYMEKGKILGIWLVQDETEGISIPWMCNISKSMTVPFSLMNASIDELKAALPPKTPVLFASTEESVQSMAAVLFPNADTKEIYCAEYVF